MSWTAFRPTNTLSLLSSLTIPLMLLMLGTSLARIRVRGFPRAALLSCLRIGMGTAAGFVLANAFGFTGPERVAFGSVVVDFVKHEASRGEAPLELTPKEFEMLQYFAAHRGAVVSRDALLDAVWGYASIPNTRTVDTHIVKLRQKVEDDPREPRHLITMHGMGYKFVD